MREPLFPSLQPYHSQLAQSSDSPGRVQLSLGVSAQMLNKPPASPSDLSPPQGPDCQAHPPPPQTYPTPALPPSPWLVQRKGPGKCWGWTGLTSLFCCCRHVLLGGTLRILERLGGSFMLPVFRQGGPGQAMRLMPTHMHTHTHTSRLVLGGDRKPLNKDSTGKLPSVSQWSLPPSRLARPNCRQGCQHEKGQWGSRGFRISGAQSNVSDLIRQAAGSRGSGQEHRRDKINLS